MEKITISYDEAIKFQKLLDKYIDMQKLYIKDLSNSIEKNARMKKSLIVNQRLLIKLKRKTLKKEEI